MPSYNRVIIAGNITRDIELRSLRSGTPLCEVGVAINENRRDKNGNTVQETIYVDVTFWDRQAEAIHKYCAKGDPILIEGRLKLDEWEQNGQKRSKLKVTGDKIVFLKTREDGKDQKYSKSITSDLTDYGKAPKGYTDKQSYDEEPDIPF